MSPNRCSRFVQLPDLSAKGAGSRVALTLMVCCPQALVQDKNLKKIVVEYAKDQDKFFSDFADAFSKLLELGVPFKE